MSRFTVTWWDDALQELAQLWIDGDVRDALSAATAQIDAELSRDAQLKGQEVSEGLRRIEIGPLRAYSTVREDDRTVAIVGVRRTTYSRGGHAHRRLWACQRTIGRGKAAARKSRLLVTWRDIWQKPVSWAT